MLNVSPPITHPPPHIVQGSIPIVSRPIIQGQVIGGQVIGGQNYGNTGATIIQPPTPIIKPVVYQTVESPQQAETI